MSEADPIVHVIRPRPPWRSPEHDLTECGIPPRENLSITREEFLRRYKRFGRQRTAMLTCMTCLTTFERWSGEHQVPATWEDDPVAAMAREAEKLRWSRRANEKRERLATELAAIIQLVEQHRSEFDEIIARLEWSSTHKRVARNKDE